MLFYRSLTGLPINGAIKGSGSEANFEGLIGFSGAVMILGGALVASSRISKGGMKLVKI